MKRKKISLLVLNLMAFNIFVYSQPDKIDYFGQTPPGDIPEIFADDFVSNEDRFEAMPVFSPDGLEFYFTVLQGDYSWIMVSKFIEGEWTEPANTNFGGGNRDWGNCFSPDGNTLYFNSADSWTLDIWYMEKENDEWSEPMLLSENINSLGSEIANCVSNDSILYFRSSGGEGDIYYSEKINGIYNSYTRMGSPVNNILAQDENPIISSDGSYMVFNTRRYGTYGITELCVSYRKESGQWTNPKNLGQAINEDGALGGSITPDDQYLLFSKNGDIYWVEIGSIIDSLKSTNYTPYVRSMIPDQTITIGDFYNYTIPDTIFFDDDGNETLTLTASLSNGSDLPDSLTFSSETNTLSGKLIEAGNYNIKVTATDTAEASASDIFRLVAEPVGVSEMNTIADNIRIFPNPANQIIQIRMNSLPVNDISYQLYDMGGRIVTRGTVNSGIIDISEISKGIYILNLRTDKEIISKMVLIE